MTLQFRELFSTLSKLRLSRKDCNTRLSIVCTHTLVSLFHQRIVGAHRGVTDESTSAVVCHREPLPGPTLTIAAVAA